MSWRKGPVSMKKDQPAVLSLWLPGRGLGPTPSVPGPFPDEITCQIDKTSGLQAPASWHQGDPGVCKGQRSPSQDGSEGTESSPASCLLT